MGFDGNVDMELGCCLKCLVNTFKPSNELETWLFECVTSRTWLKKIKMVVFGMVSAERFKRERDEIWFDLFLGFWVGLEGFIKQNDCFGFPMHTCLKEIRFLEDMAAMGPPHTPLPHIYFIYIHIYVDLQVFNWLPGVLFSVLTTF